MNSQKQRQVYCFGPYCLNMHQRRLWRDDVEIKLRPKLFDLLCLLVERYGEMLEKDELIHQLWPDSIVEDNNLTVTVNALRAALSDQPYIETVSKRGYRFAAEVKVVRLERNSAFPAPRDLQETDEPPGGAVPLHSRLYISRPADDEFRNAIIRGDSIVLVKGARQVGKTSLLARGLQEARSRGAAVLLIDFQHFSSASLASADTLLSAVADMLADQLGLESAGQTWKGFLGASSNFERFIKREVFPKIDSRIVWGLDEVDRLFGLPYASEIFGLFRSWHNLRALDPEGQWRRLTLAIAYATEAHLFITDLNQSPFNVGTRLSLGDFTREEVESLNQRYGSPLKDSAELSRFIAMLGGHPYLTQRGLYEISRGSVSLDEIEKQTDYHKGPFGDHLQRMLLSLQQDGALFKQLRDYLASGSAPGGQTVSRLRSAGILSDDPAAQPGLRCELYSRYLKEHLR